MIKKTPSFGDIIDARCSKCNAVTNHVVLAMVGIKPLNVECNTCNETHRYRALGVVRQAPKKANDTQTVKQEEWDKLRSAMKNIAAKEYDMDMAYRVGTMIKHPSFGFGLVQRLVGNRKMEILFEEGKKLMRCK